MCFWARAGPPPKPGGARVASDSYRLRVFGLPVIESVAELAAATHLSPALLYHLCQFPDRFYRRFSIPKKSGAGARQIRCPARPLKALQAWLLRAILDSVKVHPAATAFRKGHGLRSNVTPHRENRYFLCLDIEDFFPSIGYAKVWTVFRTLGYNAHMSHVFASICTCDGVLPQGGVTSPALSNIVCFRMDARLAGYCGKHNVAYTRYADDMTLSATSPRVLVAARRMCTRITRDEGFALNERKTRVMGPRQCRHVTGLVVSDRGTVGVGRRRERVLRAAIARGATRDTGLTDAEGRRLRHRIRGWLDYLQDVDRPRADRLKRYRTALLERWQVSDQA